MTRVSADLLNDTYNLIQLARETARLQGQQNRVDRLASIADDLRPLVSQAQDPQQGQPRAEGAGLQAGLLAQDDFKVLLKAVQDQPQKAASSRTNPAPFSPERNQVVLAMAEGGMTELDIARQMGMTRDEVHLVLSVNRR